MQKYFMNHTTVVEITHIKKEDIQHLQFPCHEVLADPNTIENRKKHLEHAVVLGNTYKGKTKIIFEDSERIHQIDTHIWGLTEKWVILKQGITIPIRRIHDVII